MPKRFANHTMHVWLHTMKSNQPTTMVQNGAIMDGQPIKWRFSQPKRKHGMNYNNRKNTKIVVVVLV